MQINTFYDEGVSMKVHCIALLAILTSGLSYAVERAHILALATALPEYSAEQSAIAEKIMATLQLEGSMADFINRIYDRTAIKRRYSVLKDIEMTDSTEAQLLKSDFLLNTPMTGIRNDIYIKEAPALALKSAQEAIAQWKGDVADITHIISISCTGVMAPGIEFLLQKELGLTSSVQRIGLNFMGCFGAFRGLAVAASIAKEDPKNRVLMVCTELCSLHVQADIRPEVLVSNALFGDGSAAAIIGGSVQDTERSLWQIERSAAQALSDSLDDMTWALSDYGCVMTLSSRVPKIIEKDAPAFIDTLISPEDYQKYTWAIHPGGKSIVQALERVCQLNEKQTSASWHVLENHGNMSSATFLFVLNKLAQEVEKHPKIIGLGFGPGLSIEGILLTHSS